MSQIKKLSDSAINKIAAGEVVERPLSVVKELVENAIDAGADNILVEVEAGGRNLIRVTDNGSGIAKDQMEIALQRHTTSKLSEENIHDIKYLGFRGEALASIASVSKFKITSKEKSSNETWEIQADGGEVTSPRPSSAIEGTVMEVRDLFCFTPVRLKFLKSEKVENANIIDLVNKFALLHYNIEFALISNGKKLLKYKKVANRKERLSAIKSHEFVNNVMEINLEREGLCVSGWATIPTYNKASSSGHYIYVNNRIVKDRFVAGVIRVAYRNVMPGDRHSQAVLFIDLPASDIDANVHPTKTEIRFKDEQQVRGGIIRGIKNAIESKGLQTSTVIKDNVVDYIKNNTSIVSNPTVIKTDFQKEFSGHNYSQQQGLDLKDVAAQSVKAPEVDKFKSLKDSLEQEVYEVEEVRGGGSTNDQVAYPLGLAKCQIGLTYIVAETEDGLILVDQHAAHERLVLEKIKGHQGPLAAQSLLIPEVVDLDVLSVEKLMQCQAEFETIGIKIERNGTKQIVIKSIPKVFGKVNVKAIVNDLIVAVNDNDYRAYFEGKRDSILGNIACHSSIRSGRKLTTDEMNAILREMEQTGMASQCNHGRPTYTRLTLSDLEKIFERC